MKKLKTLAIALASALCAFSFAGCANNSNDGNNATLPDNSEITENDTNTTNPPVTQQPANPDDDETVDKGSSDTDTGDSEEPAETETLGFANVGEKYSTVMKPIYDVTLNILDDLIESGDVTMPDESLNPKITSIRFFNSNPTSLTIFYTYDLYIQNSGIKSQYLVQESSVALEEFSEFGENYKKYYNFLKSERKYECREDYVEKILPMAEEVATIFAEEYEIYKSDKKLNFGNHGKKLILKNDGPLSAAHKKIIDKINETIPLIKDNPYNFENNGESVFPLIDYTRDLIISAGKESVSVRVVFQNFMYDFRSIPYKEDKGFTDEYVLYMHGQHVLGYAGESWYNPTNEEVAEMIDRLKIEELDFPHIGDSNQYSFFTFEHTFLYF